MRSNICRIENGTKDLEKILRECEKVAVYNELDEKQGLHLRLLCEELDGMLPELIGGFEGRLWIEFEEGVCRVCASIEIEQLDSAGKEQLIRVAKNQKNAAAGGIVGRIRAAVEDFFLDTDLLEALAASSDSYGISTGCYSGLDYPNYWSLEQYKSQAGKEKKTEAWDELEKSVIASVADDVIVGAKGKRADIIIVKKFA